MQVWYTVSRLHINNNNNVLCLVESCPTADSDHALTFDSALFVFSARKKNFLLSKFC